MVPNQEDGPVTCTPAQCADHMLAEYHRLHMARLESERMCRLRQAACGRTVQLVCSALMEAETMRDTATADVATLTGELSLMASDIEWSPLLGILQERDYDAFAYVFNRQLAKLGLVESAPAQEPNSVSDAGGTTRDDTVARFVRLSSELVDSMRSIRDDVFGYGIPIEQVAKLVARIRLLRDSCSRLEADLDCHVPAVG